MVQNLGSSSLSKINKMQKFLNLFKKNRNMEYIL